jgi:hypothetical protein
MLFFLTSFFPFFCRCITTLKVVPLPRDFKSETMAIHVSQRGKAHPSEAILRTLEDKRLKYFKVRLYYILHM